MRKRMGLPKIILPGLIIGLSIFVFAQSFQPRLGRVATPEEINQWNITVLPNGEGLPAGSGNAQTGRQVYDMRCSNCHGANGKGTNGYSPLVGGVGSLTSDKPVETVGSYWPYSTTVWDYVHRAMPYENPGTLSPDDVYAVTAYILRLNNIIGETEIMDQHSLPKVRMPNRDGFVGDPRPDVKSKR